MANEKEKKDSVEETSEEMTEETTEETSEENEKEEKDASKKNSGITPEATFDSPNGKSVHRPIVYVELVLAIVALVFIIIAILNYRKSHNGPQDTLGTEVTVPGTEVTAPAEIDNSAVAANKPAIPDPASLNKLTEDECKKRVADGTMLRLDNSDGTYVYVNNYKDSEYFASQLEVTEEVIDRFIQDELLSTTMVPVASDHEVAELNDIANIDYCGKKDGVAFDGGTAAGCDLELGSGTFIPGFEEGVVGMKIGETKDIPLTFPADYHSAELAGQEVIFTVTLNSITAMGYTTELNDQIANYLTGGMCPTVTEMKDYLRENVMPSEVIRIFLMEDLYISGLTESDFDTYYQSNIDQIMETTNMYGISFEEYVGTEGYSLTEALDMIMEDCIDQVRADVLYRAVLENDLEPVNDDDIAALASNYGYAENVDEFVEQNGRDYIMQYLIRDKAGSYLEDLANQARGDVEETAAPEETETPEPEAETVSEESETTETDGEEVSENADSEN